MVHNGSGILGHLAQALSGHQAGGHHASHHAGGEPQNAMNWSSSIQAEKTYDISAWTNAAKRAVRNPGTQLLCLFGAMLGWVFVVHYVHHTDPEARHPLDNATWRKELTLGSAGQQEQQFSSPPDMQSAGQDARADAAPVSGGATLGQDSFLMAGMGGLLLTQSPTEHAPHPPRVRGSQRLFGARDAAPAQAQADPSGTYVVGTYAAATPLTADSFGAPRNLEEHDYAAAAPIGYSSPEASRAALTAMAPPAPQPVFSAFAPSFGQPNIFGQSAGATNNQPQEVISSRRMRRAGFVPPPPPMTPSGFVPPPPPMAIGDAGAMANMYNMPTTDNSGYAGNGYANSGYGNAAQSSSGRKFRNRVITSR
jgi:hypothetical protein